MEMDGVFSRTSRRYGGIKRYLEPLAIFSVAPRQIDVNLGKLRPWNYAKARYFRRNSAIITREERYDSNYSMMSLYPAYKDTTGVLACRSTFKSLKLLQVRIN